MHVRFLLTHLPSCVFQATGMELNLSKNGISCGDPGMIIIIMLIFYLINFLFIIFKFHKIKRVQAVFYLCYLNR